MSSPQSPWCAPVSLRSPLDALAVLADLPAPFLLHSTLAGPRGRWSFFGADPFATFDGPDDRAARDTWRRLRAAVAPPEVPLPFAGGLVGYWAYDFGRALERLPAVARDDLGLPAVRLGAYDVIGAFDHERGEAWLVSSGLPADGEARRARARDRLAFFEARLAAAQPPAATGRAWEVPRMAASTFAPAAYRGAVDRIREHIRAGDIFQANLSQRWTIPCPGLDPGRAATALHAALADISPAGFAACLGGSGHTVISASPERFLEVRAGKVETRPIKGTRPRGDDPAADRRLAAELMKSEKDRAENVMIVDVLRNDLGRVCDTGSVHTAELCALESFAQVHHLTSTITGTLAAGADAFDLLHACFPGGSITGAPKIRAMEVLERLEPVRRHIYTGSVGYVDWSGDADWNIAIRTVLAVPGALHFSAGGGITADSDPEAEFRETLHKAEGLRHGIERAFGPLAPVDHGAVVA